MSFAPSPTAKISFLEIFSFSLSFSSMTALALASMTGGSNSLVMVEILVAKVFPKLISSIFKYFFFLLIMNKEKKEIYYQRFSGLANSIAGKKSWYRPKV